MNGKNIVNKSKKKTLLQFKESMILRLSLSDCVLLRITIKQYSRQVIETITVISIMMCLTKDYDENNIQASE